MDTCDYMIAVPSMFAPRAELVAFIARHEAEARECRDFWNAVRDARQVLAWHDELHALRPGIAPE